jgi:predicted DNA-binding protein
MAKKRAGERKMPATAEKVIRHARIELPDEEYERLKSVSKSLGLAVAAYIRQAVMRQLRRDEEEMGK